MIDSPSEPMNRHTQPKRDSVITFITALIWTVVISLQLVIGLTSPACAIVMNPVDPTKAQYKIDVWQTEQGLPLNTVQTIYQTKAGYLWVGTSNGLTRFDGVRFATFENSTLPELSSSAIFGFMEDAEGYLWIGHTGGASRFREGRFERIFSDELLRGRRVWAFAQAPSGVVWAASENGLIRWDKGATKVFTVADGLPTNRLRTLAFDQDGTLWIGTTGGGLVSYQSEQFKVMNPTNGLFPHLEVRHVLADPNGGIWAATAGAGLVRVLREQVKTYSTVDGLPTNQLTYLSRDKTGALWIGTWGAGVSRFSDGRFSSISSANGMSGDQIWSVHVDREGSVWAGTWHGGLNRLMNRAFGVLGKPEGLSSDSVRSVIRAKNGALWIATAGGGINRIEEGRITTISKKDGLSTDETSSILEDRDGAIWIASYTDGITRMKDGKFEKFSTPEGLPNVDVRAIYQDRMGTIWAGTSSGLASFNGKGFTALNIPNAPQERITAILQDRSGVMWIGTAGLGLMRYRNGVFETLKREDGLVSNWILALYEDADGALWVGTNGEGMNRIKNGLISPIRNSDGLWDGTVQVIIEDRAGYLWMTCNRGFFRVSRTDLNALAEGRITKVNSTGFGPGDSLRNNTFAGGLQAAGAIDSRGQLWLPSLKGLVIVDPARLPGSGEPPPVIFEDVSLNGVSGAPTGEIVLPPGSVPLSIRYTAGTLLHADRVRFRYMLENITQNWVEVGKNREASFPALPHGNYRFRVAASTDGNRWQEATEALAITVKPHYYQTSWFIAFAILGSIATAVGLYRLRTHQLHHRHAEMERLVEEKTEALRLANEHLSRLSFADALTGLPNRRRLDETLDTEWRRAYRLQTPIAIVIVDIDAFKAYNDTLGHPEGDQCLIAVAEVIRHTTNRAGDFAARYGGEEFCIIIPGADRASAITHAEILRKACEARAIPHPTSPAGPVVTISLGVAACVPSEEMSIAALISEADSALYQAKKDGRNRVR